MKTKIDKIAVWDLSIDNVLRNVINWTAIDVNYLEKNVANDWFMRLLIQTDSKTKLHFKSIISSEWKAYYKSFINWEYSWWTTEDDDKLSILKRNSTVDFTSWVTVKYNPTITTIWTQRANLLILGGIWPKSTGWASGTSESIIWPDSEFLIEMQNVSWQAKDMHLLIETYEEII